MTHEVGEDVDRFVDGTIVLATPRHLRHFRVKVHPAALKARRLLRVGRESAGGLEKAGAVSATALPARFLCEVPGRVLDGTAYLGIGPATVG